MTILFIGFSFSIHTCRWIDQLSGCGWEIHFYPSMRYKPVHLSLKDVYYHSNKYNIPNLKDINNITVLPVNRIFGKFWFRNKTLNGLWSKFLRLFRLDVDAQKELETVIRKINPDIIHTLESQHAAYLFNGVDKKKWNGKWIHSVWGIDLDYFQYFDDHQKKIRSILNKVNFLTVEGKRDITLAKQLGFTQHVEIIQSTGGLKTAEILQNVSFINPSQRKAISVKGTQNEVRRALFAIAAIQECVEFLKGYKIYIYSATEDVINESKILSVKYKLDIEVLNEINQKELFHYFSISRLNIIINKSDGVPNAMLESMLMGAFPIQSDTSCADEYIQNGINGILVSPENTEKIKQAVLDALQNDKLVDNAAEINRQLIKNKLEYNTIREKVIKMYLDNCSM